MEPDGTPTFQNDSKFTDLLNWYRSMYADGLTGADIVTSEDLGAQFSSMLAANSYIQVLHHYHWTVFNAAGVQGAEAGNIVIPAVPPGPAKKTLGFGGTYLMGSNPPNPTNAWDLEQFLGYKDKNGNYSVGNEWVQTNALLQPYPDWFGQSLVQNALSSFNTKYENYYQTVNNYFTQYSVSPSFRVQLPWWADFENYGITTMQSMITGGTAVSDVPGLLANKATSLKAAG